MTDWDPVKPPDRRSDDWATWCNDHPVARDLGMTVTSWDGGQMTYTVPTRPYLNPNGAYHGGLLAASLDHALSTTAMLAMPFEALPSTVSIDVDFLRPAMPELRVQARVTRGGRSLVFTRADVFSCEGQLCATAGGVFAVLTRERLTPTG